MLETDSSTKLLGSRLSDEPKTFVQCCQSEVLVKGRQIASADRDASTVVPRFFQECVEEGELRLDVPAELGGHDRHGAQT